MSIPFSITLSLCNCRRFEAQCSYNSDVIGVFKTIPSRKYEALTKTWNFDVKDYMKLVSLLRSLHTNLKIQEIPSKVLDVLREIDSVLDKESQREIDLSVIGSTLHNSLMPFQRDGILFGIKKGGRVLIADDMGLGKTLQAIGIAAFYRSEWPLLIICPSTVRIAWSQAIVRWLPAVDESDINITLKGTDDPTDGLINIMSYELVCKLKDKVKRKQFKVIVADESHYLKNSKAERTRAIIPIVKSARRVILLSGTPALSRPEELFTQINAVNPSLYSNFVSFAYRYCNAKKTNFGLDSSGSSNLEELKIVLEQKLMIRRLKSEVMNQLPEKLRQVVTLDPSLVNVRPLEDQRKKVADASKQERHGALMEYFHSTSVAKVKAVSEYVKDMIVKNNKFLLFAHHQYMMDAMVKLLKSKDTPYIRIDGSTNARDRQTYVDTFQEDPECQVAVLSILAANVGISLTAATFVVFTELYWNPGALVQAEDRAFRIGQKNAVTIIYLIARKTADDHIWPLVQEKLQVLANAGLSEGNQLDAAICSFQDPKQKAISDFFQDIEDHKDKDCGQNAVNGSPSKVDGKSDYKVANKHQGKLNQFFKPCRETDQKIPKDASSSHTVTGASCSTDSSTPVNRSSPLLDDSCFMDDDLDDSLLGMDDDLDDIIIANIDEESPPLKKPKL